MVALRLARAKERKMKALLVLLCLGCVAGARVGEKLEEFKARIVAPSVFEKTYKGGLQLHMFETNDANVAVYSIRGVIVRERYSGIDIDFAEGLLAKFPGKWNRLVSEKGRKWENGNGLTASFVDDSLIVTDGQAEPILAEVARDAENKKLERF